MSSNNPISVNQLFIVGSTVTVSAYVSDVAGLERVAVTTAQITSIKRDETETLGSPITMTSGSLGVYGAAIATAGWLPGTYSYTITLTSTGGKVQHQVGRFVLVEP